MNIRNFFNAKRFSAFLIITVLTSLCTAESFRVRKLHFVRMENFSATDVISVGLNDAVSIKLPADKTFIAGLEFNIKIPESVAAYRDSVAYSFYEGISPLPDENIIDYSGTKNSIYTIPGKLSETVYVPLNEKFSIKKSPYSVVVTKIQPQDGERIFLRFQIAMKGVPGTFETALLGISVKPVLSDEGYLSLTVNEPSEEKKSYTVYIDDRQITSPEKLLLLDTGEHHLSIISEAYRNEMRTFRIEQAKTSELSVTLKGIEPTVNFLAPENASVYFDDTLIENKNESLVITKGEHKIKFIIGDYEIQKTLNAVNGRSYTVNLNIDAIISEE